MTTPRTRLLNLLRSRSISSGRVELASGRTSDFFVDCKQAVLTAEGHALAGVVLLDEVKVFGRIDAIAGVELGGCPLASAVATVSFMRGCPIDAIYVRKEAKGHGSKRLLEGNDRIPPGGIVLLEDVITTGASALRAAKRLQEAGYWVAGIVALVDRLEGGREAIEAARIRFRSVFTRADFEEIEP